MEKNACGFTLIELMIVVAIIAIIAAIAIPNLLRARIAANEGSAIGSMRSLATAQSLYKDSQGTYADTLETLSTDDLIDAHLSSGRKSDYKFEISNVTLSTWEATAMSEDSNDSGAHSFYIDESGIIRSEKRPAIASEKSEPLDPAEMRKSLEFNAEADWVHDIFHDIASFIPHDSSSPCSKIKNLTNSTLIYLFCHLPFEKVDRSIVDKLTSKSFINDVIQKLDENRDKHLSMDEILKVNLREMAQSLAQKQNIPLDDSITTDSDDSIMKQAISKTQQTLAEEIRKHANDNTDDKKDSTPSKASYNKKDSPRPTTRQPGIRD